MNSRRLIAAPEARTKHRIRFELAMSALGHKPTYAVQHVMSALVQIATEKADIRRI
jgi:hypothetical protein